MFRFVTKWQQENPDFVLDVATSSAGIPCPNRMQEVNNGKSDALILPSNLGQKEVIENQKLDLVASEPVASNNTYILIGKSEENAVLLADVDRLLAELKTDGTLDQTRRNGSAKMLPVTCNNRLSTVQYPIPKSAKRSVLR